LASRLRFCAVAVSGVLRLRLVTAGSGGPGHRPTALQNRHFCPFNDATPDADPAHSRRGDLPKDIQGPITSVGHEANRNAALSAFEKAERLRIEAATESRVNPAYLRGARRCRVVVLVTRDRMLDDR
jgi:hypothetical protein